MRKESQYSELHFIVKPMKWEKQEPMWWFLPLMPLLMRLRHEKSWKFVASLGYITEFQVIQGYSVRSYLTIISGQGGRDEIKGGMEGKREEQSCTGYIEKVPGSRRGKHFPYFRNSHRLWKIKFSLFFLLYYLWGQEIMVCSSHVRLFFFFQERIF